MELEALSSICSGLGIADEDDDGNIIGFTKGEFCLDNLRDMQRLLRRDDPESREVFKQLCKWNVVSHNLIPIIEHCNSDPKLVLNAVKVLVFLTMPIDPSSKDIPCQMEYLWKIKAAIMRNNSIAAIISLLVDPLESLEAGTFSEDEWKIVQLVVTFFRNALAIQEVTSEQKASAAAVQYLSLKDKFLELLFHENVIDLILVLAQHISDSSGYLHRDNLLFLELFYFIFCDQEVERIAKSSEEASMADGDIRTSVDSLKSLMEEEEEKKKLRILRNCQRHSQFNGTFTQMGMGGSKTLLRSNPLSASADISTKLYEVQKGPVKRIAWDPKKLLLPKGSILSLLHDFVNQFLSGTYNVLMQSVKDDIKKEHITENNDIMIFFGVAEFATLFQYHKVSTLKLKSDLPSSEEAMLDKDPNIVDSKDHGDMCGPIASTLNEAMFFLVFAKWRDAFDTAKQSADSKFSSASGSVMKSMINMLSLTLKLVPDHHVENQTARIILYKIFYDQSEEGLTSFIVNLIKCFDINRQSKSDLADLIEIIHNLLQLMENLQARGTLRVVKKLRKNRKRKLSGDKDITDVVTIVNDTTEDGKPADACESTILADSSIENVETNSGIQLSNECLTSHSGSKDEIIDENADVDTLPDHEETTDIGANESAHVGANDHPVHEDEDCTCDDDQPVLMGECDFSAGKLINSFANNCFIHKLCWLLKFYKSNLVSTNCQVVSLLQRICDDLGLSPMLYQLSILITFRNILEDPKMSSLKEYTVIISFLKKLVREMLKKIKRQPLLFIEILFWKTHKDCRYINAESLLNEVNSLKKHTQQERDSAAELDNDLSNGTVPIPRSVADALGDDEADLEFSHRVEGHFNEREEDDDEDVFGQTNSDLLKHQIEGYAFRHQSEGSPKQFGFNEEQAVTIKNLYHQLKEYHNCAQHIADALDPDKKITGAQVSAMLKQLGLRNRLKRKAPQPDVSSRGAPDKSETLTQELVGSIVDGSVKRHSLKRVQAFSKEQETIVRELFERYKYDKNCSKMIANALGPGNTYSPAKISRKLRQLGLFVRQRKKKLHDEADIDGPHVSKSDEEMLMTLRREKRRHNNFDIKDGFTLTDSKASAEHEDSSDEVLSTLFKKRENGNNDSGIKDANRIGKIMTVMNKSEFGVPSNGFINLHDINKELSHHRTTEMVGNAMRKDGSINLHLSDQNGNIEDELAGEDDLSFVAPSPRARRRAKMVLDLDDDE